MSDSTAADVLAGRALWAVDCSDATAWLRGLPDASVQCCVTSPPYYGLRSYLADGHADKAAELGLEPTVEAYVARLVAVLAEVRRVLRPDGTLWCNLGDSYASNSHLGRRDGGRPATMVPRGKGGAMVPSGTSAPQGNVRTDRVPPGLKPKDLIGMPWRVALALQAAGWWLRSDIIWSKTSPMPESVTDRPTRAHEYLFLLSRSAKYYYDAEAVKVAAQDWGTRDRTNWKARDGDRSSQPPHNGGEACDFSERGANLRSVWPIAGEPFNDRAEPARHFAVMPSALVRPCVLAGTSAHGACAKCGAPWKRLVERGKKYEPEVVLPGVRAVDASRGDKVRKLNGKSQDWRDAASSVITAGWSPSCRCQCPDVRPCVVLDCFAGAGTVAVVSRSLGRAFIGCDLNSSYVDLARRRIGSVSPLEDAASPAAAVPERSLFDGIEDG